MVKSKIDEYGRILIPKKVRESLSLESEEDIQIRVRGSELVLRPSGAPTEEKVEELAEYLEKNASEPSVSEAPKEESKWMTGKRAMKKLGL